MSRSATALIGLLRDERAALRRGDIPAAGRLAARKARLLDRLETEGPGDRAVELAHAAERSQALLHAARTGIEAARRRVDALRNGVATRTYSARGDCTEIRAPANGIERRA